MPHLISDTLWSCESRREYLGHEWSESLERFIEVEFYDYVFMPTDDEVGGGRIEITGSKDGGYILGNEYHFEITAQQ